MIALLLFMLLVFGTTAYLLLKADKPKIAEHFEDGREEYRGL